MLPETAKKLLHQSDPIGNNRNWLKRTSLLGFLIIVCNSPVYWILHGGSHVRVRGGGAGGEGTNLSLRSFMRSSSWSCRLSTLSFILLRVSCKVWFWSICACLFDRSSSILAVIMSFICFLWASMSALNCSSKRLLSFSRFSCSSFNWKENDFRFAFMSSYSYENKFTKSRCQLKKN